jgi:hypothetical protein
MPYLPTFHVPRVNSIISTHGSSGTTDSECKHKARGTYPFESSYPILIILTSSSTICWTLFTVICRRDMATMWQQKTMLSECSHCANSMSHLILLSTVKDRQQT